MFSKVCAALAAALLIVGLVAPALVLASDGTPPTCSPDSVNTDEDTTLNGTVPCTDVESGDQYDVVSVTSHGTVTLDPDAGTFQYDPAADYHGSDAFDYRVLSVDGNSTTETISITVNSVNDRPTFTKGGNQTVAENSGAHSVGWATAIDAGAPNESGQTLTFTVTNDNNTLFSNQPDVSPSGTLTYTSATNENGSALVSVTLQDNGGIANGGLDTSVTRTFTITVTGVNDPPSFTKGGNQTDLEDAGAQSIAGWATAISKGPPDESSQTVTFLIDSNSNGGLFSSGPSVNGSTGTLTYTPAANASGVATIVLHAHDNGGGSTDDSPTQSFTITVTAVNDVPSFTKGGNQNILSNAGAQTLTGWATAISEGPGESAQTVSFTVTNNDNTLFTVQPAIGPTGTLTYTPKPSAAGVATVSVQLVDNGGTANGGVDTSAAQTFTVSISGINDPPSFTKGANVGILEDPGAQTVSGWATAISEGPPDESSQTVSFVVSNDNNALFSSQPAVSGTSGNLTFTPALNTVGSATVSLYAQDSGGTANGGDDTSAAQSFTITVNPVNDPPSFVKGSDQTVLEDSLAHTVSPWATALSAGPADEAGQTLTFVVVSNTKPTLFSVLPAVGPTGVLTYTLAANINGTATVGVELHDNGTTANGGDDTSAIQTFKINVTAQNDPPACTNFTGATFVGSALNGTLTTCTDIDGDALKYAIITAPTHGAASITNINTGAFTYTPAAAFQGNDSFTFQATDPGLLTSTVVTMSILVSPDPIAKNDVAPTDFPAIRQGSGPTAIPVLANDVDKQGGPLSITAITQGSKGTVAITGGGTGLTYDPTGFATGTDSFRYTITDNQLRQNSATVVVVISPATPRGSIPVARMVSPSTLGATTGKTRITWTTTDVGTGLRSYQLQQSYNGGAFTKVTLGTAKSTSSLRALTFGKKYVYRIKVTDTAGNVSPWSTSPVFVISRNQETAAGIVYTGPWGLASSTTYSAGKARYATAASASATFSFTGQGVSWVSSRSPSRGSAQVLVDGVLVTTVSLYATKLTPQQVVFSRALTAGLHTIKVINLATAGHPRVDVDVFVVTR
jgi:VCBS repeat-containing protein